MKLRIVGIRAFVLVGLLCILAAGPTGASEWEDPAAPCHRPGQRPGRDLRRKRQLLVRHVGRRQRSYRRRPLGLIHGWQLTLGPRLLS